MTTNIFAHDVWASWLVGTLVLYYTIRVKHGCIANIDNKQRKKCEKMFVKKSTHPEARSCAAPPGSSWAAEVLPPYRLRWRCGAVLGRALMIVTARSQPLALLVRLLNKAEMMRAVIIILIWLDQRPIGFRVPRSDLVLVGCS